MAQLIAHFLESTLTRLCSAAAERLNVERFEQIYCWDGSEVELELINENELLMFSLPDENLTRCNILHFLDDNYRSYLRPKGITSFSDLS